MKKYPRGKLCEDDDGETKIAIAVQDKTVIIAFPQPTIWIGLDKQTAITLANTIMEKANSL